MNFLRLFQREPALLIFGLLFCFGSTSGQTSFVPLFVPSWAESFTVSEAMIANIYAGITLASAAALPFLGRLIDRMDLLTYSAGVCGALALGCWLLAGAWSLIPLTAGLALVRLGGQGLMSHVALTSIARHFERDRGKALALSTMGFPLGEIVFPALTVFAIGLIGWRVSYAAAGVMALIFIPLAFVLVANRPDFRKAAAPENNAESGPPPRVFRTFYFALLAPLFMAGPLLVTALIFHQGMIAEAKGFSLQIFAGFFALFAVAQVAAAPVSGVLIDRFSARKVFPFHLLPFALGCLVMASGASLFAVAIYMALAGATAGIGATARNAIIAELVRPERLGAARSALNALMVVATAIGPALFGWLMLGGVSANGLLWFTIAGLGLVSLVGAFAEFSPLIKRPVPPSTALKETP